MQMRKQIGAAIDSGINTKISGNVATTSVHARIKSTVDICLVSSEESL
jgi:hypothetical protein